MKRFKKFLALGVAASMMIAAVGCGSQDAQENTQETTAKLENAADGKSSEGSGSSDGKTVITWWVWASTDIANQMAKAAFEANPELAETYEIEPVLISSATELVQKFRMMLAAGETMPDIMMFQSEFLSEFAQEGILTDLSDVINPYREEMTNGAYNLVSHDDKQWGFPYQIKPSVWTYRSDMFEEAGIDVTTVRTTEDFIAAGKQLQETFPDSYIWQFNSAQFPYAYLVHILSGNGGAFFDDNGNYILDSDPGVRAAWEDIKKIYDSGIVYDVVADSTDQQQGYANGTIASDLTGTWIKNNMQSWAPDLSGIWEETQWPSIGGGTPGGEGGSMFVVPENSLHSEGAIEILSALSLTVDGNLNAYRERSIYPSLKKAIEDDLLKQPHRYMGASLYEAEAEATKNFKSFKYSPKFNSEVDIIVPYLAQYLQGQMSLEEALSSANNDLIVQLENAFDN